MSTEPDPHALRTNLAIVAYTFFSALTLIGVLGFVVAGIDAALEGFAGRGWFVMHLGDYLREPAAGQPAIDLAIHEIWRAWIGLPVLGVAIIAAILTLLLAMTLGNEPKR